MREEWLENSFRCRRARSDDGCRKLDLKTDKTSDSDSQSSTSGECTSENEAQKPEFRQTESSKPTPKISIPVELLRSSYDVVVIGSGYGGAVAASRMSRAGQTVCVLERGKERWPGEYPYKTSDVAKEMYASGIPILERAPGTSMDCGNPTGMYHVHFGEGQTVVTGQGLGGSSLINANVFLRPDEETMNLPHWPKELRESTELDEYYRLAEEVLQPTSYPENWPQLPKLSMLERQAKGLGQEDNFERPRLTTRFTDGYNSTGVHMKASKLTGQDTTGLNDGSKSSTLVNYLSDAWNWGAEMFCECEVRYVSRSSRGGYLVYFAWHGGSRGTFKERFHEELMFVHAKKCVFLGAGSMGTTEILLRSREHGLNMSSRIGKGMSGNGDIYAFGYNCDSEVNSLGNEHCPVDRPVGPTISGMIDCRKGHENVLDGYVIQEGAAPGALAPFVQTMIDITPGQKPSDQISIWAKFKAVLAQVGSRIAGPYFRTGSIERTQIYLVMSHDTNQAILTLKDDKPYLDFLGVGRSEHVKHIHDVLARASHLVGGTFVNNPLYALAGQQEVTVHPIGGACMSSDGTGNHGVTNHFGEVFSGDNSETHCGLVVTDGAAIPTSLGVNPLATITALAERSVRHMAEQMAVDIDYQTSNGILDLFGPPKVSRSNDAELLKAKATIADATARGVPGFGFTEVMSGYMHVSKDIHGSRKEDFEAAKRIGRSLGEAARFFLSVKSWDIDCLTQQADHAAMLTGTFTHPNLPGSPFIIHRGSFHLFTLDEETACTRNLSYDFDMISTRGEIYHFHGLKMVNSAVAFSPGNFWKATSTLYATITKEESIVACGILDLSIPDLKLQARTLTATGSSTGSKLYSHFSFAKYFLLQSARSFFTPFNNLEYPLHHSYGFTNPTVFTTTTVTASDGHVTELHTWHPMLSDGRSVFDILMIPGAAVDHQIFSLATIPHNAVQHFTSVGYRVHVIVHRIGGVTQQTHNWTTFDARLDIRAALKHIKEERNVESIYVIAHCMGSVAFACGLLDGTIPSNWIKGITCSQVFMNPIWASGNMAKVKSPVKLDATYRRVAGEWFPCESDGHGSLSQRGIDQMMRLYPDVRRELCSSTACHRCTLVFGRCWNHGNLNAATHRQIDRFFGGVNMTCLHLLMEMGRIGHVTTNFPQAINLVTKANLMLLKGIPFFLFSSADSDVLSPECTEKTYEILTDAIGCDHVEREVLQGYGHLDCWMGTNAHIDVYPMIQKRIDGVCRGYGDRPDNSDDDGFVHV